MLFSFNQLRLPESLSRRQHGFKTLANLAVTRPSNRSVLRVSSPPVDPLLLAEIDCGINALQKARVLCLKGEAVAPKAKQPKSRLVRMDRLSVIAGQNFPHLLALHASSIKVRALHEPVRHVWKPCQMRAKTA